jgi:hypothetical protein
VSDPDWQERNKEPGGRRYCPWCGSPTVAGRPFCPSCGKDVSGVPSLSIARKAFTGVAKIVKWVGVAIIVVVVGGVGLIWG